MEEQTSKPKEKKARGKWAIEVSGEEIEQTLDEAFEEFIKEKSYQGRSKATLRNYKQTYDFFKEYHGLDETTLAKEIEKEMVYEWIGDKAKGDISPASLNHYIRDIRTFLYWCMDDSRKYIEPFKLKEKDTQEQAPKRIPMEMVERLIGQKPQGTRLRDFTTWRSYAIACWIAGTGNRAATIREIRIGDLDFTAKEITLKHTKNKKAQKVPFSDATKAAIRDFIRIYRANAKPTDYLFTDVGTKQLSYNAMRIAHERYCEYCKVPPEGELDDTTRYYRSLHALRHTFAYNYYKQKHDIVGLQAILGHSNIAVTKRYVSQMIDDLKENYEDFSLLDNVKKKSSRAWKIDSSKR